MWSVAAEVKEKIWKGSAENLALLYLVKYYQAKPLIKSSCNSCKDGLQGS